MSLRDLTTAAGLAALVLALYLLSGPGRLDSVDALYRFEVAQGILERGEPSLAGTTPLRPRFVIEGAGGGRYSVYSAGGSIAGLPLVALGDWLGGDAVPVMRFFFSWTSAFAGAGLVAALYAAWRALGVPRPAAAGWGIAAAFSTLLWPISCSGFEQSQQALLLLGVLLGAWRSGRSAGGRALGWTLLCGICGAALINYQEAYFLFLPLAGLACWRLDRPLILALRRLSVAMVLSLALGACAWMIWNQWRFGDPLSSGKWFEGGEQVVGRPWIGVPALLFSPGKGALWYSPPILLALAGLPDLWRRDRSLAQAATLTAAATLVVFGSLGTFSGDRCWGPRMALPALILLTLALPFVRAPRWLTSAVLALGLLVQGLGLSMDHHRFFEEKGVPTLFYLEDPGFYFRESALLARPAEIRDALSRSDQPAELFARSPLPSDVTYPPMLFSSTKAAKQRFQEFAIFRLPRPWPLWAPRLPGELEFPLPWARMAGGLLAFGLAGAGLLGWGIRR